MIEIKDKAKCSGCWACENACPVHCIAMLEDEEGFHYPHVNIDCCIECHRCEKVCPELQPMLNDTMPIKSFIVQHKDSDILRNSTSGGFYSAIAKYAIDRGGVVFGAAFDDSMTLCHQCAETLNECNKFRGSKYVQSLVGNTFQQVKSILKEGRMVVYSGTPCQISGLYCFLDGCRYDNLITVDLVCHGTPSPRLLKKYLEYQAFIHHNKVRDYRSRDKFYGYDYSTATIFFENPKDKYHQGIESDLMLRLYFKNLISRPSCYSCHFKTINRVSDFTIFDCWDATSVSSIFSRNGATNVFIHSENGIKVFDYLKESFNWVESDTQLQIDKDGIMLKHFVPQNPQRAEFFRDLQTMSIEQLEKKYDYKSVLRKVIAFAKPYLFKMGIFRIYLNLKRKIRLHQ